MIIKVAVDAPLRRLFDYRAPDSGAAAPGMRVLVPFGRRRTVGVVVSCAERSDVPAAQLRQALDVLDAHPVLDPALLSLLVWAAEYYRSPIGEVIAGALPAALRAGRSVEATELRWALTPLGREAALGQLAARAVRLRRIVELLASAEQGSLGTDTIAQTVKDASAALRTLESRGYVERQRAVASPPAPAGPCAPQDGPPLNDAQQAALERISGSLNGFACHLLHGVTGSGKTEVYLNAIARVLARGAQALVLAPEIALTPQLIARFKARFTAPLAVAHSGLSDHERLAAWRAARSGQARIVIGTRSAVFMPLTQPGLIIVDEEHDPSFKQQDGFRYSARDLAIVRAQRLGIPIVLGSATPSLEALERAQRQPQWLSRLPQRAGRARPPRVVLIDLRKSAQTHGLATPALLAIRRHLDAEGQVMLFLNRRGYAPVLFCPACGWAAQCRRCDAHLTVHSGGGRLICHHCGVEQAPIAQCPNCQAAAKPVGQGTQRIEETLRQQFPDAPLARIDRDSIRRKGELESLLERVRNNEVRILVGTQMLTKGHDFPNVTLVVVLNADQGLFSADFRASERLAQTIVQVAGRAGRAERPGEVLIQTEYPDHPLLSLLLTGGYEAFAEGALNERRQSGWPPYARIALLRAEASRPGAAMSFLKAAHRLADDCDRGGVRLLGPAPAPMERRAGLHRAQLLLQADSHAPLQRFLGAWLPRIEALDPARRVRWSVDVDAAELF
ncbi:MAG: primosomal protein N' [Steroidobacteraceae bacterium]|jgi:primosomal protein N' (replication factor Y)|nr:primosomal protein N' [Steroidobacteraceae bacterium]